MFMDGYICNIYEEYPYNLYSNNIEERLSFISMGDKKIYSPLILKNFNNKKK